VKLESKLHRKKNTGVSDNSDDQILALLTDEQQKELGFRVLMKKYQERLYWHIRGMVSDHDDADDVLQNTFIKVFKNIHRFKKKSSLFTWMYRIATNEAITFLKKEKRRMSTSIDQEGAALAETLRADVFFDGNDAVLILRLALNTLPDKQKQVFQMRYYDELSYQEISDILLTSVGALKASYHHAVKKIEQFIKHANT
jgi:RNA polymerase sigma-70 factor (ECF subfamily)